MSLSLFARRHVVRRGVRRGPRATELIEGARAERENATGPGTGIFWKLVSPTYRKQRRNPVEL